jgi:hypothetical protein
MGRNRNESRSAGSVRCGPARLRMRRCLVAGAWGGVTVAVAAHFFACGDSVAESRSCNAIPQGGCPARAGQDPCADLACAAVYTCAADRRWVRSRACASIAEADASVSGSGERALPDAQPVLDTGMVDGAPPGASGGPGCAPLQAPDCALAVALACSAGCCGCEDLFVCTAGGWSAWGNCAAGSINPL